VNYTPPAWLAFDWLAPDSVPSVAITTLCGGSYRRVALWALVDPFTGQGLQDHPLRARTMDPQTDEYRPHQRFARADHLARPILKYRHRKAPVCGALTARLDRFELPTFGSVEGRDALTARAGPIEPHRHENHAGSSRATALDSRARRWPRVRDERFRDLTDQAGDSYGNV
jgi:hypothetical protein